MRHPSLPSRGASLRGFTLVELLVVIAIIGTLVALLLPAVQSARESARNNTCKNSLKNLSLGMLNFDSSQGELPGYINDLVQPNSPKSNGAPTIGRQASWVVMLFPYIERNNEWDIWNDFSTSLGDELPAAAAPEIELLECPSDAPEIPGNPWNNYVVNAGQMFSDTSRGDTGPAGQIDTNVEYVANGVFFDKSRNKNIVGGQLDNREDNPPLKCSIDYISSNDGTSNTAMMSESLHTFYWTYEQPESNFKTPDFADAKRFFGFMWANESDCDSAMQRINGDNNNDVIAPPDNMFQISECHSWPSSNHPGGVNVAFCDGRVVYITDSLDPQIYAQIMTSSARRSKFYNVDDIVDRKLPPVSDDQF